MIDEDYIILLVLLLGAFGAILVYAVEANNEFDERCRARGGEPVHTYKSRTLCLRPGSIIDTEEP